MQVLHVHEILVKVFTHFDVANIAKFSRVCKRWKQAAESPTFWKEKFHKDYPSLVFFYESLISYKKKPDGKCFHTFYTKKQNGKTSIEL